jgi:tripartite-type tricarboxylate transporter receptor subunit TctC
MKALFAITRAVLFVLCFSTAGFAESYPTRPVTILVPFPAGSGPDVYARIIGAKLSPRLGQPVVVENRAGGGGTIGGRALTRAEPDGYTILFGSTSSVLIAPAVAKDTPYDPVTAFAPVIQVVRGPFILSVRSDLPVTNLKELIAYAKANPGKLNYGTSGTGSLHHLATEMLKREAGIDMTHIPFPGGAQSWTAMQSGVVDVIFDSMPGPVSTLQAGKARAIAVTGTRHMPALPQFPELASVPTFAEQGVNNIDVVFWFGVLAPAGTPKGIVDQLNAAIAASVRDEPQVKKRFVDEGMDIAIGSAGEYTEANASGAKQWGGLVNTLGLRQQ